MFLDFLLLHSSPLWWKGSPKGNQPEYLSEGLMLNLQHFCHLMEKADSLEKTLMLGKKRQEDMRTTEGGMVGWHHWLNGPDFEQVPKIVKDRKTWRAAVYGVATSQVWLIDCKTRIEDLPEDIVARESSTGFQELSHRLLLKGDVTKNHMWALGNKHVTQLRAAREPT